MGEVRPGLVERADRVETGYVAPPEAGELGEDEPDPVPGLATPAQLADDPVVAALGGPRTAPGRTDPPGRGRGRSRPAVGQGRPAPTAAAAAAANAAAAAEGDGAL